MLSEAARAAKAEKDRAKINHYRRLTQKVLDGKSNDTYTQEYLDYTSALLELNPEFNAVWNYRRNIVISLLAAGELDRTQFLSQDLRMTMAQLKMFPKCYWIWNHRTWCLQQLEAHGEANWDYELAIVLKLLELDSRNFHGWHYRRYVVSYIEKNSVASAKSEQDEKLVELAINLTEFAYTTSKINKNISNFSAWHNRTKIVPKIFQLLETPIDPLSLSKENTAVLRLFMSPYDLLTHELDLVKTGMYMDSDDTSVWLYLQWLLTEDIFVDNLGAANQTYGQLLTDQLKEVEELNELEKGDSPTNSDHVWCLKTIIFIKGLLKAQKTDLVLDDDIVESLKKLVDLDPLRKGHYLAQILGAAPLVF